MRTDPCLNLFSTAWVPEFQTNRSIAASMADLAGAGWATYGASAAPDTMQIGLSVRGLPASDQAEAAIDGDVVLIAEARNGNQQSR